MLTPTQEPLPRRPSQVRLTGVGGIQACVLDFGATLCSVRLPTSHGLQEVLLGYPDVAGYLNDSHFMGATIGRYANRIAGGRYPHGSRQVRLPRNDRGNTLHGGPVGLHRHWWQIGDATASSVRLHAISPSGHEGFPGTLEASATFEVGEDYVEILYEVRTDEACPVNLTAHPYFRLGEGASVMDHQYYLPARAFLPVDGHGIPLGDPEPVAGTAFDFRQLRSLDPERMRADPSLLSAGGYDHCFVLEPGNEELPLAALAYCPASGIGMKVGSRMPGIQFYTGNALSGPFARHSGFCLEPQFWPDSPNRPSYPSAMLVPGETYRHRIRYSFFLSAPALAFRFP